MKHLVVSDIHGDWDALERASSCATKTLGGFDDVWCLGDVFGYCEPEEAQICLEWLKSRPGFCILGNWEWWLVGNPTEVNKDPYHKKHPQLEKYKKWLSLEHNGEWLEYIRSWHDYHMPNRTVTLVHGSPLVCEHENAWHCSIPYIESDVDLKVKQIFTKPREGNCRLYFDVSTPVLFAGHSHFPFVYSYSLSTNKTHQIDANARLTKDRPYMKIFLIDEPDYGYIVRTGSVSGLKRVQREGYKAATAMLYDDDPSVQEITLFEVQ